MVLFGARFTRIWKFATLVNGQALRTVSVAINDGRAPADVEDEVENQKSANEIAKTAD